MIDDVAKALCDAAGRSAFDACDAPMRNDCTMCVNGACMMWQSFREEARAAILASFHWNRRERRWPAFVKGTK